MAPALGSRIGGGGGRAASQSFAGKPLFVSACEKGFLWLRLTDWSGRSELAGRGRRATGAAVTTAARCALLSEVLLPAAAAEAIKPPQQHSTVSSSKDIDTTP